MSLSRVLTLLGIWLASGAILVSQPALAMENDLPYDLQQRLEEPLQERVKSLLRERNAENNPYKRGAYSHSFLKIDDSTYQVSFHLDTAESGVMKTERYLYTLELNPANLLWSITNEELQDTFSSLYRRNPGDEEFKNFDSFHLELEGLTVKADSGGLIIDTCDNKPEFLILSGENLSYDYTPPSAQRGNLYKVLKDNKPTDFVFSPSRVTIFCDPTSCGELLASNFEGLRPTTEADLYGRLKNAYNKYMDNLGDNRHDDGFSGFHLPYEKDRRNVTLVVKKSGVDHRLGLDFDSEEPREATFFVTDYGPIFSYYSQETLNSGISSYDLEARPDFNSRYFDLKAVKGTIELGVQNSQRLQADVTFTMVAKRPMRELRFGMARLSSSRSASSETKDPRMSINSFQDGAGNELTWAKTGSVSGLIELPEEIPAGSELKIRAQFINDDVINRLTPSYTYLARSGWLPFVNFTDRIEEFDLTVLSPAKFKPLAVGHIVEESKEGRVYKTRWKAQSGVTFPTVIYGDYVEGKAGFEAKRVNGEVIPVAIFVDRDNMRAWDIRPKQLRPLADDAVNAMNLYQEVFGVEYPYQRLDLVNDTASFRGQSPASLVYLGAAAFRGQGALSDAYLTTFVKSLVAHEVAHQWWGSLINNANMRNYWFVESLAEYSAALFIEARYGKKEYQQHVNAWRKEIMEAELQVSVQDAPVLWSSHGAGLGYRAAVYAQGPYMFHIMRSTFGDEKFFAFLKSLAQNLQGKAIITRDIQKEAEKAFNMSMEDFFDQWVRGVGLPSYTVKYKTRRLEDGTYMVEGAVHQQVLLGPNKDVLPDTYYVAVIRMTIDGKKGKTYAKTLVVDGPETKFQIKVPEQPKAVHLNEQGEVLAHDIVMEQAG